VLCTADKTFALKYVETTNTLLLVPPVAVAEGEEEQEGGGGPEAGGGAMDVDGGAGCTPAVVLTPGAGLQTQLAQGARARRCVARAHALARLSCPAASLAPRDCCALQRSCCQRRAFVAALSGP